MITLDEEIEDIDNILAVPLNNLDESYVEYVYL